MPEKSPVLLESGTNELEIIEFLLGDQRFAINVMKVKEIVTPLPITKIPHSHPYMEGIIELRGEVLPVFDLAKALCFPASAHPEHDKFIVAEFNKQKIVFRVHNVMRIYRISWTQIEKPSQMHQGLEGQVIGIVKLEGRMLLLLDFEKIIADVNPNLGVNVQQVKKLGKRERSEKRIIVAEDSPLLRKLLHDTLSEAGYGRVEFFENGAEALRYLQSVVADGKDIAEEVQLVITDIEMPQMDGHHFTKRIREDERLRKLPVIIFSSLITEGLRHKGMKVGATAQVSKPEIGELIEMMDSYVL
ncbi:chemotaxis protein CheV [Parageobacillus sp. VR-IP]|uniref:chemotaxis protein n=1 Tax=Parageobacillus sp. VR-IP TaxID=2742205 RepID=UPI0015843EE8|nr:chemotaxis protein [Parageobacillus sp. VR-IP]NUK28939.1 chemotaxis protein CheV [Parageobacillus sp. VR-IP]